MKKTYSIDFAGKPLVVEIGQLAQQTNGSCFVTYGDTQVLVTAVMSGNTRNDIDYFPLTIEYEEKMYSVGKIPGGFLRREGRASEKGTLAARLIDRPLRPLFDKGYRNEIQVIATVMSVEYDTLPEIVALFGASLALSISDIPFDGPAAGVNVGYVDGQIVINPNSAQREASLLDLTVAGIQGGVMMVEAGANEVSESTVIEAIFAGQEAIETLVAFQKEIVAEVGKPKKEIACFRPSEEIAADIGQKADEAFAQALTIADKVARNERIDEIHAELFAEYIEKYPTSKLDIDELLEGTVKHLMRNSIIAEKVRTDGRALDEIREISCEVSKLRRVHGSGLFQRGQTQVLSAVTLGALRDNQIIDNLTEEDSKRYIHHYNFPPFSVGETRPLRAPGRREIGHGALAERALLPVIPDTEQFPYTIRVVSEVLGSHGSTSQASVCGSTLALMDAGVPIKAAAAGIAMGLIKEGDQIAVLSDIQDIEDFYGDMDFKVAGTSRGVTAMQMDIKIRGVNREILSTALNQALEGRLHILEKMLECIPEPREEVKEFAPRIITIEIPVDKIRDVIGTGGKVINKIIADTGVKIDIMDDGKVYIGSPDLASAQKARSIIEGLVRDPEVGDEFSGKVTRILNFGCFVELPSGKEGLIHISKLDKKRVNKVEDVVSIGDICHCRIIKVEAGKIDLIRLLD